MWHSRGWRRIGAAVLMLVGVVAVGGVTPSGADHADCALRYVAGGDAVVWGKDAKDPGNDENLRYSHQLLEDTGRLDANGPWCEYNTSREEATTTDTFVSEATYLNNTLSQQAAAWEREPRLITLTLGRQNDTIVKHITDCFKNVKDHDFLDANACALQVLAPGGHWDKLKLDLTTILNTFMIQQDGNPQLIVAVTGYFNPFPSATDVATKIPGFCAKLVDTIPTCIARWVLLPPALITLDQVVQKLNTTIEEVVTQFEEASQGRFVFVNPYEKFKSHCMDMKVQIKTTVYHPTNTTHDHDTQETNFGCSDTWIGSDDKEGNKSPFLYLTPAVTGVLILATQTTKEMGVNPNKHGHDCISDLVYEAVKNKLDIPEAPAPNDVCKGDS
ncbi:MAG: hypothetical protein M3394_02415 [Actinomycetota bacterium]|nr:hypothetical protein [Actinomycetota bacterium]